MTYSVAVGNGYVFIVDGGGGLRVVDFTNPTTPIETGVYDAPGLAWGVTVERTCIYVAGGEGGLQIVDVSKPAVLAGIGAYNTPGFTYDVAAVDAYAYVADGCRGLRIVDISNPAGPIEVGFYDTAGLAKSVAVVGSYAYVADDEGGLRVVSVSNPAAPYEIGFCDTPGNARRVVVVDSCAYVADGQEGLRVIDISDPTTPYEISAYNTLGSAYDVAVVDTYAYVANGQGLQVVDVSDPTAPHEVSFYETPIYVEGVAVAGDPSSGSGQVYALVADGYGGGLRVIDVSNPAAPVEVGFYNMSGAAVGVAAVGNYAYVAGKGAGLFILRYGASITGRVADVNSAPFSGVTISASSGLNTTTDATGTYTFTNHLLGTWVLTPTLTSYSFWPATRTVTLPPDASGQNFTILPGPVSTTLTPGTASSLVYTDTQGLPTRLDSPAGVVSQTTTLVLTPTLAPSVPGFAFAGHAFELSGFRVGKPLTNLIFDTPMTVTIHYSNNDVRVVSDESQLALWWWTGAGWEDAANTCDPPATSTFGLTDRDPVNRVLSVPICRPGPFGLFGPTRQVYLPVILRNS
jgi:hypothetical protein